MDYAERVEKLRAMVFDKDINLSVREHLRLVYLFWASEHTYRIALRMSNLHRRLEKKLNNDAEVYLYRKELSKFQ